MSLTFVYNTIQLTGKNLPSDVVSRMDINYTLIAYTSLLWDKFLSFYELLVIVDFHILTQELYH